MVTPREPPPGSDPPSTYERARRRQALRHLARRVRDEDTQELLPLKEVTDRLRLFDQAYVGIRSIPVGSIVGTLDRSDAFDREFLPRRPDVKDRWKRVERSFPGGDFPPIQVYEVDGRYFLVDGHHRVAIARQRGVEFIDAEVTRIRTRFPLPAGADIPGIIHTEQERLFMEASGLGAARPEARIEFSRPQGYLELFDHIKVHGYHLMQERGAVLPPEQIAGDWYDWLYLPTVAAAHAAGLREILSNATDGDLYLAVQQHRVAMAPEHRGVTYEDAAAGLRDSVARHVRRRRPAGPADEAERTAEPRTPET